MNKFQKIAKNVISSLVVAGCIFAIALLIEGIIGIANWTQKDHSIHLFDSSKKTKTEKTDPNLTTYSDIESINITTSNYELVVTIDPKISETKLTYESNTGKVSVGVEDKELIVRQRKSYNPLTMFKNRDKIQKDGVIYLTLPNNFTLKKATFELGSAKSKIENLSAEQLSLTTDDGETVASGIYAKAVTANTGKGVTKFENVSFDTFTLDGGKGNVSFSGTLYTSADLKVDSGDLTFLVYASRDYFGINVDRGEGQVLIDGSDYESVPLTENGTHFINVSNEEGKCNLTFQPM